MISKKTFDNNKQENFRLALEAANIGVWELNTSSRKLSLSENMFKSLGIKKSSFDGNFTSFLKLIHPDDREQVKNIFDQTIKDKTPFDTEFRIICRSNQERWFRIRGNIGEIKSDKEIRLLGSIHDKTERKLAFDNLEERVKERTFELEEINRKIREEISENRKMKKIVMDISDKERQKIGQDLHDNLSQQLGGILFMVQTLEDRLKERDIKEINDLEKIKKYLNTTLKYVRNMSKGLNLTFGETGFKFAVTELAEQMNELYGMKVDLKFKNWKDIKDENIATNIFRIIQEALNNAVKHGNAKKAVIYLTRKDNKRIIRISDYGKGFPPNPNKRGMGLKIMEYRASQIAGTFEISKNRENGTEIVCEFLVNKKHE